MGRGIGPEQAYNMVKGFMINAWLGSGSKKPSKPELSDSVTVREKNIFVAWNRTDEGEIVPVFGYLGADGKVECDDLDEKKEYFLNGLAISQRERANSLTNSFDVSVRIYTEDSKILEVVEEIVPIENYRFRNYKTGEEYVKYDFDRKLVKLSSTKHYGSATSELEPETSIEEIIEELNSHRVAEKYFDDVGQPKQPKLELPVEQIELPQSAQIESLTQNQRITIKQNNEVPMIVPDSNSQIFLSNEDLLRIHLGTY